MAVRRFFVVPLALALAAGCGKKGPPLAPLVRIPAAVDEISAQRVGRDVFVSLVVPAKNVDASIPVDIGRIEVYGYTGRVPPPRARWVELGALIATVPVAPLPVPGAPGSEAPPAIVEPSDGATPGTLITVLDALTPDELVQGRVAAVPPPRGGPAPLVPAVPAAPLPLRRFYTAFGFSARGRPGPPGTAAEFAVSELPAPPDLVRAPYDERSIALEWPPSDGVVGFLFERALAAEEVPLDERLDPVVPAPGVPGAAATDAAQSLPVPAGPTRYNVYRELAPDPLAFPAAAPLQAWSVARPAPLNPMPLPLMRFVDPVELDRPRCYVVRAIRGAGAGVEGEPSPPTCVTPTDVFPPQAPARLVALADQGGISLVWEPNSEPDLGGYLVLRGEASDATLQSLTPAPVVEPRFRDTHVTAGTRYVYVVVALDGHLPVANVSAESNRVEETAR